MSKERPEHLHEVIKKLGDPNKVGTSQIWVGKDYSLKELIDDLQRIATGFPKSISYKQSSSLIKEQAARIAKDPALKKKIREIAKRGS